MNHTFAGTRLAIARQRRGLTKKALAETVAVSGAAITEFESGTRSPSADTVRRLSLALKVPTGFFYGDDIGSMHLGASFRALRSMSARVRDRASSKGHYAADIISPYLRSKFVLPDPRVPVLSEQQTDAIAAAQTVRNEWGLEGGPVGNAIHLLESKGIQVYWSDDQSCTVDAVSFWQDDLPYIVVSANRPGERQRLSVMHELGHLVLHRDLTMDHREVEKEAFDFASQVLLPHAQFEQAFRRSAASGLFGVLFSIKKEWGVSVAAALRRARDVAILSQGEYERACRELSIQGWRKTEPKALPEEESLLHEKVFERLASKGIRPADVAAQLEMFEDDLLELMPVGRRYAERKPEAVDHREHLRLLR